MFLKKFANVTAAIACVAVTIVGILALCVGIYYMTDTEREFGQRAIGAVGLMAGILLAYAGTGTTASRFDYTLSTFQVDGDYDH